VINLLGLAVVVAGTLMATMLGQSFGKVWALLISLPQRLRAESVNEVDIALFIKVSDYYRLGNIRYAELGARRIDTPLLRSGAQLVLDRMPGSDLRRTLQWRIGAQRERDQGEIRIFKTMMNLAPAFGMLGTLFGLIGMLNALDVHTLDRIGESMGYAMLSTVYGLMLANLLLKPIITRLELRSTERLAWLYVQCEAVWMLEEKCHSSVIQDAFLAFLDNPALGLPRDELEAQAVRVG
jgi:chemotaxis protein MotA